VSTALRKGFEKRRAPLSQIEHHLDTFLGTGMALAVMVFVGDVGMLMKNQIVAKTAL
jgi:hypothetical protein